ncbi:hypothetical protein BsWGS_24239 [Bradybaena similaris]
MYWGGVIVSFLLSSLAYSSTGVDPTIEEMSKLCDQPDIFRCENERNQCVPFTERCDGVANCDNGRDEAVEVCGCLPTEFQCNTTTCINMVQRCDTRVDCDNLSDELNCETYECPPTTHTKCNNHYCVSRDAVCNFKDDCGDNSDEKACTRKSCAPTEFKCNNSQCVGFAVLCDGFRDCVDGSDEDQGQCDQHFKCPLGFYISGKDRCDGWSDCKIIPADELNCLTECHSDQFRCPNSQCIRKSNVCDGYCDCQSCADEDYCDLYSCPAEDKFMCHSPNFVRCIDKEKVCDKHNDCRNTLNGQDEDTCTNGTNNCSAFEKRFNTKHFMCPEEYCIDEKRLCDQYSDCKNGEDEKNCTFPDCAPDEFRCQNKQCVPLSSRCNITHECKDWSDEANCENFQCPTDMKKCHSGNCVPVDFWCDYRRDCPDGSDERGCERRACKENEFTCSSGQCMDASKICYFDRDDRQSCADKSHLLNCSEQTCPDDQMKCRLSYCINSTRKCDGTIDCLLTNADELPCKFLCPYKLFLCTCKDDDMDCENRGFETVPEVSVDHLTKLRYRGNKLKLTNDTFAKKNYDKITYLDLSNNSLTEIPVHIFDTMWRLTYLNLGDNNLTILRNGTFHRLSMLRQLILGGNKISIIEADTFMALLNLSVLDLSNQRLTQLFKNMFKGLKIISTLNLSGNRIDSIENGAFNTLVNIISIDLSNNRIKDIGENVFLGLPRLKTLLTDSYRFCCLTQTTVDCLPKPDEFSSCEDLMSNEILRVSIWVLGVIALCGNFVVIIWRVRDFRGGKVHSFLITNLAIGDFLMGVYLLIIATVDAHYRGVYIIHDQNWRESSLCQFAGFVSTFSSELSVLTLTTITLDRLLCILFPLRRTRMGLKQALIVMSLIWCLVFLLSMLPLVGFSYFEGFYGRSGVCLALHVTPDRPPGWEYSVAVFLVLNFISFLLILFSYMWMFSVAKKTRSAVRTVESKTDNAMARRMTLIVMTDFCCWIPIIVLGFISLAGTRTDTQVYAWLAVFVLPLNSATNPIIYTLSTAPFLGNIRKRVNRFRKSFIHSFTADTKHNDRSSQSYCERKSPYRQLELMRLRNLNASPPLYCKREYNSAI